MYQTGSAQHEPLIRCASLAAASVSALDTVPLMHVIDGSPATNSGFGTEEGAYKVAIQQAVATNTPAMARLNQRRRRAVDRPSTTGPLSQSRNSAPMAA